MREEPQPAISDQAIEKAEHDAILRGGMNRQQFKTGLQLIIDGCDLEASVSKIRTWYLFFRLYPFWAWKLVCHKYVEQGLHQGMPKFVGVLTRECKALTRGRDFVPGGVSTRIVHTQADYDAAKQIKGILPILVSPEELRAVRNITLAPANSTAKVISAKDATANVPQRSQQQQIADLRRELNDE